ncbi:uncharacterized protein RJT20DRAFT_129676 [Scheffersomyces xylosifermentans]|uniref:uncharacterized protein n=1 Tax=Scheffersomyces xylosifermentans TaxID=1304137 RepID=UPI00315D02C3
MIAMIRCIARCRGIRPLIAAKYSTVSAAQQRALALEKFDQIPQIHPLLLERAEVMKKEFASVESKMSSGDFDQDLTIKFSNLSIILENYAKYTSEMATFQELKEFILEPDQDPELLQDAMEEVETTVPQLLRSINTLQSRLLPPMKYDDKPAILELRPGVGGSEASLFTGDLMQMYINFANFMKWRYTIVSKSEGNAGFLNEVIMSIDDPGSYNILRHESGVHRVQRIPSTESKGRIHTSTAAVVVLPKMSDGTESSLKDDERQFAPGEVRIDTMRAGGKGGQHVNTTDSAVRLVHIPTGVTVQQQDERSQPKNKAKAFSILRARLAALERDKEFNEQRKMRTDQVTTTDRSDKIRTYNYPQNRVTDHRCGFSLHDLTGCMAGSRLMDVIEKVEEHEFESRLQDLIADSKAAAAAAAAASAVEVATTTD